LRPAGGALAGGRRNSDAKFRRPVDGVFIKFIEVKSLKFITCIDGLNLHIALKMVKLRDMRLSQPSAMDRGYDRVEC
jgi:hypothetical protein